MRQISVADVIIKQIGIQRSGTNYLKGLFDANLPRSEVIMLPANTLGHKHETLTIDGFTKWLAANSMWHCYTPLVDSIKVVISVRDPMSWSLGYLRHIGRNKKMLNKAGRLLTRPIDHGVLIETMLNPRYKAWKELCVQQPGRVMFLRFEDLLTDFRAALQAVGSHFGFTVPEQLVDLKGDVCSNGRESKRKYDRRDYYLDGKYLEDIPTNTRDVIMKAADWETAAYFGYKPGA